MFFLFLLRTSGWITKAGLHKRGTELDLQAACVWHSAVMPLCGLSPGSRVAVVGNGTCSNQRLSRPLFDCVTVAPPPRTAPHQSTDKSCEGNKARRAFSLLTLSSLQSPRTLLPQRHAAAACAVGCAAGRAAGSGAHGPENVCS